MLKLKEGDRCEIIAVSKKDAFYENRKELIGKKFRFIEQTGQHGGGGFAGYDLESETEIELLDTEELILKNETIPFHMVKLKKI